MSTTWRYRRNKILDHMTSAITCYSKTNTRCTCTYWQQNRQQNQLIHPLNMHNHCINNVILSKTTCKCKRVQEMGSRRPFSSWPCPLQNHTVTDTITNITDITKHIQTANTFRTVVNNMTLKRSFRWELGVTRQSAPKVQIHTINTHATSTHIPEATICWKPVRKVVCPVRESSSF